MKHLFLSLGIIPSFLVVLFGWLLISSDASFDKTEYQYFSNPEFQIYKIQENYYEFSVPYKISNAEIGNMTIDCASAALLVYLSNANTDGELVINIPRKLIDAKLGTQDDNFFVLINGRESDYLKTSDVDSRTLEILLPPSSKIIEIIATNVGMFPEPVLCGIGDANGSPYYDLLSPLRQFKSGIPIDEIQCRENLQLAHKASNGNPVCVKQPSIPHLAQRSWIMPTKIQFGNYGDSLAYYLEDGEITSTSIHGFKQPDKECVGPGCGFDHTSQIIISTSIKKDGILVLMLPIQAIGSTEGSSTYSILLVDGEESDYLASSNSSYRILSFNVTSNTKVIEIFLDGKYNEKLPPLQ